MICRNEEVEIVFFAEGDDIVYCFIKCRDCFDGCIYFSGMPYHIAVGEIYEDEIKIFGIGDECTINLFD